MARESKAGSIGCLDVAIALLSPRHTEEFCGVILREVARELSGRRRQKAGAAAALPEAAARY